MAHSTQTAIKPITPCDPSPAIIPETLSTTLKPEGIKGILPSPKTSAMITSAAKLTPTSANAEAQLLIDDNTSIIPPLIGLSETSLLATD